MKLGYVKFGKLFWKGKILFLQFPVLPANQVSGGTFTPYAPIA